ncbi:hypothetical protein BJY59DRAFT_326756 [Rhodotorula toruloides]
MLIKTRSSPSLCFGDERTANLARAGFAGLCAALVRFLRRYTPLRPARPALSRGHWARMTRSTRRGQGSASPPPAASTSTAPPPATRRSTRASSANPPEASGSSAGGTGTKSRGSTPARELRRGRSRGPSVPPADLEAVAEVPRGRRSRRGSTNGLEGKGKEKAVDEAEEGDETAQDVDEQPLESLLEDGAEAEPAVKPEPVDEAIAADPSGDPGAEAMEQVAAVSPSAEAASHVDVDKTTGTSRRDSTAAEDAAGGPQLVEEGLPAAAVSPAVESTSQLTSNAVVDDPIARSPPEVADAGANSQALLAYTSASKVVSPPPIDSSKPTRSADAQNGSTEAGKAGDDGAKENSAEAVVVGDAENAGGVQVDGEAETAGDAEASPALPVANKSADQAADMSTSIEVPPSNEAPATTAEVETIAAADSAPAASSAPSPTPVTALARATASATVSSFSPAVSPAVAASGSTTPTSQPKRTPPVPAGGIAMPPALQAMTPKDVRKRFNTHKIACVQTLNVELIKVANELVKEKPLKQVEYMPLMQRLQSNLAYLTAMSEINRGKDSTRSSPPPPILEAPPTPILGPRLAASYATLKGYFVAAEKYEMQYKRGLTIVPTAAPDATGINSAVKVGEPKPLRSAAVSATSMPALASGEVNGIVGKRTRGDEPPGGPGDGTEGPDAKKGKLDLPTVPEEEVVPANPPPSNALAPPAKLVANAPSAAIGFSTIPTDNAARFNAPPPDAAYGMSGPPAVAAASSAYSPAIPPSSVASLTATPAPPNRRSATPSQPFATPHSAPPRPTSAQSGQMYGSAMPPHLQQQQAQQLQQSPTPYAALSQQQQQADMRQPQTQTPQRPPSAAANLPRPGSAMQGQQFAPQPPPALAPQQQFQPPPPRTPVQQPQQVPPSAPPAPTGATGVGGDDRPIAEQYSSVQAIISAPTFRQLPPALQQQMQTQAQNLLYQMQAQAVAAARGGGVNQAQQQRMTTPAPTGPATVASSPRNRVPSYSQSPQVAHAQVRQASVGVPGTQYAGSYAGSMAGSPPVMQQLAHQQQVRPTSATSAGESSSAAFFREQLAAQQHALRSSTPAQYAPSPQQQHMYAAPSPSPHMQPARPPSTPANYAAFGAHQRVASGQYQQQANPYYQQAASPAHRTSRRAQLPRDRSRMVRQPQHLLLVRPAEVPERPDPASSNGLRNSINTSRCLRSSNTRSRTLPSSSSHPISLPRRLPPAALPRPPSPLRLHRCLRPLHRLRQPNNSNFLRNLRPPPRLPFPAYPSLPPPVRLPSLPARPPRLHSQQALHRRTHSPRARAGTRSTSARPPSVLACPARILGAIRSTRSARRRRLASPATRAPISRWRRMTIGRVSSTFEPPSPSEVSRSHLSPIPHSYFLSIPLLLPRLMPCSSSLP